MLATTEQPHDNLKRPIQDAFEVCSTATHSRPRRDDAVTVHDHDDPAIPRRQRPWLPTRSTLIFVSIIFGFIFIFPHSLTHTFSLAGLSSSISLNIWRATSDAMTFSRPTSPAFSSNGRTDQVQWDNYTLVLHGQRVLI